MASRPEQHTPSPHAVQVVTTDVLIVGAGPAGASLACFLGSYDISGIIIAAASTTADTPRAHITNMAAMECLRDIGLEADCIKSASGNDSMLHVRWAYSMVGEELARMYSWGNDPVQKGDYEAASPCSPLDLPQTVLEPILVRYATIHGFKCRFDTEFISFEEMDCGLIKVRARDKIIDTEYQIQCKYLLGADGARSKIVNQLGLPLNQKPDKGMAFNILVRTDLSHIIENRKGNLHWIIQLDKEHPLWGWIAVIRMVKPWHEWMFVIFPDPNATNVDHRPTKEEWLTRVRQFIGDDSIPAEIIGISKWRINDTVAERYSKSNIFCLGDAVHRHPPMNGLGSNTCIQDSFNLAWKVAYVMKGHAGPGLLESYSAERQPVGQAVVQRANEGFSHYLPLWTAMGLLEKSIETRKNAFAELSKDSCEGRERRLAFQKALHRTKYEVQGLGIEMNQRYIDPLAAVDVDDEDTMSPPVFAKDPVLYYQPSTYPGCRVPHAWLNTTVPAKRISTIDLTGHGKFTLLTGIGGRKAWAQAAAKVMENLQVPIVVYSIGYLEDYEDVYLDWTRLREVEENGAVLVRPDRVVGWRSKRLPMLCEGKLVKVMCKLLDL